MSFVEWSFWGLSAFLSVAGIISWGMKRNVNGVWGLATPAGWVWIWQAVGTIIIPFVLNWSVWHLAWWFPLGFVVCTILGRILYLLGIIRF